ncbi:PrgI family mobile element protein [Cytobacillus pseudoceanisediminis]|uniref:PrgI family mobile element protein n=1 Tax=Cytobacillus pseudoceanisediminis TaxID=3051614 RepID=UPI00364A068B
MRVEKVPIDMSSEQKEILGIVSKRQLAYLAIGGIILYSYIPFIYKLFSGFGWLTGALFSLFSAAPTVGLVLYLAFAKVQKYNMNRDYYYYIRFQRKTQYGSWRKGN